MTGQCNACTYESILCLDHLFSFSSIYSKSCWRDFLRVWHFLNSTLLQAILCCTQIYKYKSDKSDNRKKGSKSDMKITIIKQQETVKYCGPHAVGTKPGQQSLPLYKTKKEFGSRRTFHIQSVRARGIQKYMLMFWYLKVLWNVCFQQCTD